MVCWVLSWLECTITDPFCYFLGEMACTQTANEPEIQQVSLPNDTMEKTLPYYCAFCV